MSCTPSYTMPPEPKILASWICLEVLSSEKDMTLQGLYVLMRGFFKEILMLLCAPIG